MSQVINGDGINLIQILPDQNIDITSLPNGLNYVQQGSNLFKVKNVVGLTFLTPSNDARENLELSLPDCIYKNNEVVHLSNNLSEHPISSEMFSYIMKYFQEIYNTHKTESCLLLLFNNKTKDWKYLIPVQIDTSGGFVKYINPVAADDSDAYKAVMENKEAKQQHELVCKEYNKLYRAGYRIAGTIHSHCDFNAYHSGTDDADEENFDGLHITIGNVNSGWSFSARIAVDGAYFMQEIGTCVRDFNLEQLVGMHENLQLDQNHLDRLRPDVESRRANNRAINLLDNDQYMYRGEYGSSDDEISEIMRRSREFQYGNDELDFSENNRNFGKSNGDDGDDLWFLDDVFVFEDEIDDMVRVRNTASGRVVLISENDYDENRRFLDTRGWEKIK